MDETKISWPGWETMGLIGHGNFGAVYEIRRKLGEIEEKAALKVSRLPQSQHDIDEMYSNGYDEEDVTTAFQSHLDSIISEYSLMRKMNGHTNIVSCDDIRYVQHDDGIGWDIFIKMELLTPLTKALPAQIDERTTVKIAKDICAALVLCKKSNIVHRDVKPQNIFMSEFGDYKLGDFGIAKTVEKTSGGTMAGTGPFMAPEVAHFQPYGHSADIYSLGIVLYWLLNERRLPFMPLPPEKPKISMELEAKERRLRGEPLPAPAHGSKALQAIVLKACAYDPAERYHTAEEMLQDLEKLGAKPAMPELVTAAALAPKAAPEVTAAPAQKPVPAPEQVAKADSAYEPMTKAAVAESVVKSSAYEPMAKAPAAQKAAAPVKQAATPEQDSAVKLSPAAESYRQHYQQHYEKAQAPAQKTREQIAEEYRRNYQALHGAQQNPTQTPQSQELFYTHLPNDGWRCACGRVNAHYVTNCACGAQKSEMVPIVHRQRTPTPKQEVQKSAPIADMMPEACDPKRQKTIRRVKTAMFILTAVACLQAMICWRYMWYISLRDLLIAWMIPGFVLLSARPKCQHKWENSRESICRATLWAQCALFVTGVVIGLVMELKHSLSAASEIMIYISPAVLRGYWATRYTCGVNRWSGIVFIAYGLVCLAKNICAFRIARQLQPKNDGQ